MAFTAWPLAPGGSAAPLDYSTISRSCHHVTFHSSLPFACRPLDGATEPSLIQEGVSAHRLDSRRIKGIGGMLRLVSNDGRLPRPDTRTVPGKGGTDAINNVLSLLTGRVY